MRTKWKSDLSGLLIEYPYLDKDEILLVKLVTFTRIKSPEDTKYESNTKICPATFEICNNFIRWRIQDTPDTLNDNLIIQTPLKKGVGLGHTNFENIDEIDSIYIVTAYRIIHKEPLKQKYDVYAHCKDNAKNIIQTISTETLTEARSIAAALKANGINTKINKMN